MLQKYGIHEPSVTECFQTLTIRIYIPPAGCLCVIHAADVLSVCAKLTLKLLLLFLLVGPYAACLLLSLSACQLLLLDASESFSPAASVVSQTG